MTADPIFTDFFTALSGDDPDFDTLTIAFNAYIAANGYEIEQAGIFLANGIGAGNNPPDPAMMDHIRRKWAEWWAVYIAGIKQLLPVPLIRSSES